MKKTLPLQLLFFFLLKLTPSFSQGGNEMIMDLGVSGDFYNAMDKKTEIKGTPFLFEDFVKGNLILNSGKIYEDIFFNINLEKNELYARINDETGDIIVHNRQIDKVVPKDTAYSPFKLNNFNGKNQYIEVIYEKGGQKLMVEHSKNFVKASSEGTSTYETAKKDEYAYNRRIYLVEGDEETEVKPGNKGYKTIAGNNWKKVKEYAKSNNLDFSNSKDLFQIFKYSQEEL